MIEIVKSYMKEMVTSYKDEMLKERQNEKEARLEIEVEKIKQLLGKPKKLQQKQLELLMKHVKN